MTRIQYEPTTREIAAHGEFDDAPEGLALAEVGDDARLGRPGAKFWRDGRIEVVSPPEPTAEEVAARQAEAQADADDRTALRDAIAVLLADAARLEDTAQAMTAQQIRAHAARTARNLARTLAVLRRRGVL